jgi:hypothetical protein
VTLKSSEVQSAHEIERLERTLLALELRYPQAAAAIGGPIVWAHPIDTAVTILRRSEIEAMLGVAKRRHSIEETCAAGADVFAAVQSHIEPFEGLDFAVATHTYAWRLQTMAKRVLREVLGSVSETREIQAAAAGPRPLTVCFGRSSAVAYEAALGVRRTPASELQRMARENIEEGRLLRLPGVRKSHGDGCHRAHPESKIPNRLFKAYCDGCATGSGNRQRALERAFHPGGRYFENGDVKTHCACGNEFVRTRSNQTRCPECRREHRVRRRSGT